MGIFDELFGPEPIRLLIAFDVLRAALLVQFTRSLANFIFQLLIL